MRNKIDREITSFWEGDINQQSVANLSQCCCDIGHRMSSVCFQTFVYGREFSSKPSVNKSAEDRALRRWVDCKLSHKTFLSKRRICLKNYYYRFVSKGIVVNYESGFLATHTLSFIITSSAKKETNSLPTFHEDILSAFDNGLPPLSALFSARFFTPSDD